MKIKTFNRSTVIVVIIIFICVVAGGLLGFYFYLNSSSTARNQFGPQNVNTGSNSFGNPSVNTSVILPGNASTTQPTQAPEIKPSQRAEIPLLRRIHSEPVAGMDFFTKNIYATTSAITETVVVANGTTSTTTTRVVKPAQRQLINRIEVLQFIDRASGHIFETASNTLAVLRVSNTTVPKVYEARLLSTSTAIMRGLYEDSDVIQTRLGRIKVLSATSSETTLITQDLPLGMNELAVSPSKDKLFYLTRNGSVGVISNVDNSGAINVFESAYKEWLIAWPNQKLLTITTKASAFAEGFMYSIDPSTRVVKKVLGNKVGLTTLMSPDTSKVIYSITESGTPNLYVYDTKTNTSRNVFLRTFSEKCVWSVKNTDVVYCAVPRDLAFGDYPDVWYQGLISFSDQIWRINTRTGENVLMAELDKLGNTSIDVINPTLNSGDTYLMFNNKKDLSLWGLQMASSTATSTPVDTRPRE